MIYKGQLVVLLVRNVGKRNHSSLVKMNYYYIYNKCYSCGKFHAASLSVYYFRTFMG